MGRVPEKALRVAVVGGSIAGCTAAVELSRAGCEVTVYERTGEQLKDRGAGIAVPRAAMATYVERDLVDSACPNFPVDAFLRIWRCGEDRRYGRTAWDQPAALAALNWGTLYRNLRARVPADCYLTQRRVTTVHGHLNRTPMLEFEDGGTEAADLIVCADGYASLGRQTLFPDVGFEYAGYVLWRGALAESELNETTPLERGVHCVGYPDGHGIFYFVPGPNESIGSGERLVNWGMYLPVPDDDLETFLTDRHGARHIGSLPPGSMPGATQARLKALAASRLPAYYCEIVEDSEDTFAYAIHDCQVPAYHRGRVCLVGDAGAFARPHSGAGALKGMQDAISLAAAISGNEPLDAALAEWGTERTAANNRLVQFGNQLGRALVEEIPDWSTMDVNAMRDWFESTVTIASDYIRTAR